MIAKSTENEFYFLAKITVSKIMSSIQSKFAGTTHINSLIKSEIILVVAWKRDQIFSVVVSFLASIASQTQYFYKNGCEI